VFFVAFGGGGRTGSVAEVPIWTHAREIVRSKRFWLYFVAMFCGGGAEGAFTFWSASYAQLNLDALARGGAFATASFAAGMVIGRLASGHFVSQRRLPVLIIGSALLGIAASLAAWAASGLIAFMVVLFLAGLTIACFWPSIQSHAAASLSADATMLFILLSMGGIPGFGFSSWLMGIIAARYGLRTSLLVIPALLAVLAVVMGISVVGGRRRNREAEARADG
jgi:fucose permease